MSFENQADTPAPRPETEDTESLQKIAREYGIPPDDLEHLPPSIQQLMLDLYNRATTDGLTGLAKKDIFLGKLKSSVHMAEHAENNKRSTEAKHTSVLFIDLDKFKSINDTLGHAAGDIVLKKVSETIQSKIRATDTAARYGGEEIVVLLPGATIQAVTQKAEEIREAIQAIVYESYPELRTTASIGVASTELANDTKRIMEMADDAMYVAKESGRNKVVPAYELLPNQPLEKKVLPGADAQ